MVEVESLDPILRVIIWLNEYDNAAIRGKVYSILNPSKPGLKIIKTPKNPIKIANQLILLIFSFKKKIENNEIIIGATNVKAVASPKGIIINDEK